MSPTFGSGSIRPEIRFEVTQSSSRSGGCRVSERSRAAVDKQPTFRAELISPICENCMCERTHVRLTSVRPFPRSSDPPPVSSRRVVCCCVAAKATAEVGHASPLSSPRAVVARRAPAGSSDGAASVGVVIIGSVMHVVFYFVCRSTHLTQANFARQVR